MEIIKNKIILFTLGILVTIITFASIIKVYTNHRNNLYKVLEKKITETCKACFLDEICKDEEITLGYLIRNGYITNQIDPITKEEIKEDLPIKWNGKYCKVNIN